MLFFGNSVSLSKNRILLLSGPSTNRKHHFSRFKRLYPPFYGLLEICLLLEQKHTFFTIQFISRNNIYIHNFDSRYLPIACQSLIQVSSRINFPRIFHSSVYLIYISPFLSLHLQHHFLIEF